MVIFGLDWLQLTQPIIAIIAVIFRRIMGSVVDKFIDVDMRFMLRSYVRILLIVSFNEIIPERLLIFSLDRLAFIPHY